MIICCDQSCALNGSHTVDRQGTRLLQEVQHSWAHTTTRLLTSMSGGDVFSGATNTFTLTGTLLLMTRQLRATLGHGMEDGRMTSVPTNVVAPGK